MKKILVFAVLMTVASLALAAGQPQTTCPVMKGSPVNKSLYVDADGYRIYVCCGMCQQTVQADPAKYIAEMKAAGVELEKAPAAEAPKAE